MSIGWVLNRDWIVVDQAFAEELDGALAFHQPAPGSTLVLVARSVRHAPDFVLRVIGHPVVVITESYDGNGGAIDTSGLPGDTTSSGTTACPLSLYALCATNVRLIASGGAAGPSRAGGNGGLVTFRALAPKGIQAGPELSGRGGSGATAGASIATSVSWYTGSAQWRADADAVLGTAVIENAA